MGDMIRDRPLYEAATLDAAIRQFLVRWTRPDEEDERIRRDFEADFVHIVQRIYHDAQKPFLSALADALSRAPMPPVLFPKEMP
jgi:hypothetical protein